MSYMSPMQRARNEEIRHARVLAALIFTTGLSAGLVLAATYAEFAWYFAH